jgi:dTDP-4-dehydrorhamnose 3,5-epimerase-like enzyme
LKDMFAPIASLAPVTFPIFRDERGVLGVVEAEKNIPFEIRRVFWIFDVPADKTRAGHAHKECHQFLVCCCGRMTVEVSDGVETAVHALGEGMGIHIPPGIFATVWFIQPGSLLSVFCDRPYDKADYIFDRAALKSFRSAAP